MINKENNDKEPNAQEESGIIDTAKMEVQCHLLIKDKETGEVLVNKRG